MPYTLSEVDRLLVERQTFRNVLLKDEDDLLVLAWIGNECRAWSQDPALVVPELAAFWNKLLGKLGIVHPYNLVEIARRLAVAANDDDIERIRNERPANGTGSAPSGA